MDKSDTALKPNYFLPINKLREMKEEDVEEAVELKKEAILAGLSNHEGWRVLKEYIQLEMDKLDNLNKAEIESGASFDDIGRNAVLIQLCKEELQNIINKVEDAREESSRPKSS